LQMNSEQYWNPLVPELTVSSLETSLRFYQAAGFSVCFQRANPPFAYLELGDAQIMLEQQHADGWNVEPLDRPLGRGINFQIEVADAESTLASLQAVGAPVFRPLRDTWYAISELQQEGQREFLVQDPDGYLMRFAQYLGTRNAA
jgi:predicted enzyme related to lactoylglutathione lyase